MLKLWRKKEKDKQGQWFLDNGSVFLRELFAACDGKTNPIRSFSSDRILKATRNFDFSCVVYAEPGLGFTYYKGYIGDRFYIIKRVRGKGFGAEEEIYNDLVVSARVSNHKNFLRLLGCCLEFPFPVFVFEFAEIGVLDKKGRIYGRGSLLPWNARLKIAKEVSNAVTYLHTAFPKIIIHGCIKPTGIFLDKDWTPKLSDFSISISPSEGKSQISDDIRGTWGFLDSFYCRTGILTEYSDVFSFGILLLVLLTGEEAIDGSRGVNLLKYVKGLKDNRELIRFGDEGKDIAAGQRWQMEVFLELALRCCEERAEDRPKMIEVAKELKLIERSLDDTSVVMS